MMHLIFKYKLINYLIDNKLNCLIDNKLNCLIDNKLNCLIYLILFN
jgi:hypothetical protein